jgi:predicted metal-dependent hydrolase
MRARKPDLDFSASLPIWTESREFSHLFNAFSVVIMELEPFMNRVMRRARDELAEDDPLREEISVFVRQEANHTLLHRAYNQALYDAGYSELKTFERQMAADYAHFLEDMPLLDLVAYCEGFECLGPILAELFFETLDDVLAGGDPKVVDLWKWHLAEEYEHRKVAYDVYHRLGGGWWHRLRTTYTTLKHLGRYRNEIHRYLMTSDWEKMSEEDIFASKASLRALARRLRNFVLRRAMRLLLPWYSPRRLSLPRGADQYLNTY